MSETNRAPSAAAAAQQFMDLSQEYLQAVPIMDYYTYSAHPDSNDHRWFVRVMSLATTLHRKFTTSGENTYLPGLMQRIYEEHKDSLPARDRKRFRTIPQKLSAKLNNLYAASSQYSRDGSELRDTADAVDLILNGRLVHADYEKWDEANEEMWQVACMSLIQGEGRIRSYVKIVRSLLIELHMNGVLPDLQFVNSIREDKIVGGQLIDGKHPPAQTDN